MIVYSVTASKHHACKEEEGHDSQWEIHRCLHFEAMGGRKDRCIVYFMLMFLPLLLIVQQPLAICFCQSRGSYEI